MQVKPENHFKPRQEWQQQNIIPDLASGNKAQVNRALAEIAAEPAKTTPYGLLLAARGHLRHGQLRTASLYYYAARLRSRFDGLRFPADSPSAVKHDRLFSKLARQLSQPVYDWAFASPERLADIKRRLRKWEMETAYAYKPLYPTPKMRQRKHWPKLHKRALKKTLALLEKRAEAYKKHRQ